MRWVQPQHVLALLVATLMAVPPGLAIVMAMPGDPAGVAPEGATAHADSAGAIGWVDAAAQGADPRGLAAWSDPTAGAPAPFHGLPASVRIEPGVAWSAMAPPGSPYSFVCPTGPGETFVDLQEPTNNVNVIRADCPFRIIDDGDLLGSPQLAVRSDDVREVAFFSLHGAASGEGPTPRSRDYQREVVGSSGQTHTVFASNDGGWMWSDNPYGREGLGETAAGIMTRDGNLFVASLFSQPLGDDATGTPWFDYHLRLHEESTVTDNIAHRGPKIDNRAPGNQIEEVNLVLVKPAHVVETAEQYEAYANATRNADQNRTNGTAAPSNSTHVGQYAIEREPGDHSLDLVAAVWHERAYDWRNASTGKSSWVQVMWRSAWEREDWTALPVDQLVGPCRSASNPVAWNGRIYVACVVDAGYQGRRDARIGDVDIWAIEPHSATKQFISHVAGLGPDGRTRLAANDEGRFAITTTRILPNGDVDIASVEVAWGFYGRDWDPPMEIGTQMHGGPPEQRKWALAPLRDARVTAMEIARIGDQDVLFLSFMERLNGTVASGDPTALAPVEYRKLIGSWESCTPYPMAMYDLNVGVARHPFQEGLVNDFTGAFDDLHDGMDVALDPATGMHLVHFAYGDHGVIQYGAIDARALLSLCPIKTPPLLYVPIPPAPQAVLLASGVGVGTAVSAGSLAALGLGSLLIAKRRVALAAAVKAK